MRELSEADLPVSGFLQPQPRRKGLWAAGLLVIVLINLAGLVYWMAADTRPLAWDQAIHTENAIAYRDRLATGPFLNAMRPVYFNYPPLYNLSMLPFLTRVPDIADAGAAANLVYLAILIVGCYFIGSWLMGRGAGLVAAAVIGAYPITHMLARQTLLDLALAAWVTLAFYALLRSDSFRDSAWSMVFGILAGLAMLTKWTAFAYLAGPILPALFTGVRRRNWGGLGLAVLMTTLIMAPWYIVNGIPMLIRVSALKDQQPASGLILTGWQRFLWYPIGLFEQMHVGLVVLFLAGLVYSFFDRELRPVLLWFFVSLFLFSLISNRNVRYSFPALPAAAVLTAALVRGRRWGLWLVLAVATASFTVFHFNFVPPAHASAGSFKLTLFDRDPARTEDWKHREIIDRVKEIRDRTAPFSRVVTVSNAPYFHSTTLRVTASQVGSEGFGFKGPSKSRWTDFAEFILVKTGYVGPEFASQHVRECAEWVLKPPAWFPLVYEEAGRWPLPDGSEALLYHAEPEAEQTVPDEMLSVTLGEFTISKFTAKNVDIRARVLSASDTARGLLRDVTIACGSVDYRGIVLTGVEFRLDRPRVNLPRYREESELQILSLERVTVKGSISADTVLRYAAVKAKALKDPSIRFEGDTIRVKGDVEVPVELAASLRLSENWLEPRLETIRIAGIRLPTILFSALVDRPVSLAPNQDSPFWVDLGRIDGDGDTLRVGRP